MLKDFLTKGWALFQHDEQVLAWAEAARPVAEALADDPDQKARWMRCGGTWFAGVNVFPNDTRGGVPEHGVPALAGEVIRFINERLSIRDFDWDRAQISICYPGYPQPWDGESEAAYKFRKNRDAAHVDGLRRTDPGRRRSPSETHAFILGLPLNRTSEGTAPLVVYEGSHEIMRQAFINRLSAVPPGAWSAEDVTDAYVAARGQAFETCRRVEINALPGQAYLAHRLALHGVAPWTADDPGLDSRMIAYFRPDPRPGDDPDWWLTAR